MRKLWVSIPLAFLLLIVTGVAIQAAEVKEHPVIRPYPGSVLGEGLCKHSDYSSYDYTWINPTTGKKEKKTVKGEYWYLLYEARKPNGERNTSISKLEFFENFKAAAQDKGGKVVFEDAVLVFTFPKDDGGTTWCQVATTSLGQTYLTIIDEKGFTQKLTFGPQELKEALDRDGRVMLYGIHFDTDKACLKQESDKQLQHIVTLLATNSGLKLEIQGHTDDQGSEQHNMELSQKRAQTVQTYLTLYGIDKSRIPPRGYGETKPVDTNDTESGRAKNRRVELIKM